MAEFTGPISYIEVDAWTATVALVAKGDTNAPGPALTLYADAPNTFIIPQLEVARRSWVLSLLQNAYIASKDVVLKTDDNTGMVTSVHVIAKQIFIEGTLKHPSGAGAHPETSNVKPMNP